MYARKYVVHTCKFQAFLEQVMQSIEAKSVERIVIQDIGTLVELP